MNPPPTDGGIQWDKVYLKIPSTEIELNLMEIIGLGIIFVLTVVLIWRVSQTPAASTSTESLSVPSPSRTYVPKKKKVPVYVVVQEGSRKKLVQKKLK